MTGAKSIGRGVPDLAGTRKRLLSMSCGEILPVLTALKKDGYCGDNVHPFTRIHFNECERQMKKLLARCGCDLKLEFLSLESGNSLIIIDVSRWNVTTLGDHLEAQKISPLV